MTPRDIPVKSSVFTPALSPRTNVSAPRLTLPEKSSHDLAKAIDLNSFYSKLVKDLFKLPSVSESERKSGLSDTKASRAVLDATTGNRQTAALHGPDQVAGGRHDEFAGLGDFGVNSSIGANWGGGLAVELTEEVNKWMAIAKVPAPFWRNVAMNVLLKRK